MWWNDESLNKKISDKNGRIWSFKVWMGHIEGILTQRIFFWDGEKEFTGIVEYRGNQTIHKKRIKDRLKKLVKEEAYRDRFIQPLEFPLENNY